MSRLDEVVNTHNQITAYMVELDQSYTNNELHEQFYENERERLIYALEDLRDVLSTSLARSKDPVTLARRLRSSYLKHELLKEIG